MFISALFKVYCDNGSTEILAKLAENTNFSQLANDVEKKWGGIKEKIGKNWMLKFGDPAVNIPLSSLFENSQDIFELRRHIILLLAEVSSDSALITYATEKLSRYYSQQVSSSSN